MEDMERTFTLRLSAESRVLKMRCGRNSKTEMTRRGVFFFLARRRVFVVVEAKDGERSNPRSHREKCGRYCVTINLTLPMAADGDSRVTFGRGISARTSTNAVKSGFIIRILYGVLICSEG